ncbi:28S ribosomal protein S18c, mitochondrial-like isoform X3 [Leptonychotes weddellii]|uniref:28S ribosomal protein S18c, mitochondrial-like isoform X3 n=1 Tax=Leptonychotes weddellii TaxID=9713 RepID=A0A7F8PWU3_LEPWE|nr:28S ribosomal protein S18c, mitochondrial-like isoform X3 [Leptonychotes weddellii]
MATLVAICGDLGRKKLTHFVKAALCLPDPGTHVVLWRSRSQYKYTKQVAGNEDLPVLVEDPYKEPLKKIILCGKRIDYKNTQVFVGRNRKKSQMQLREFK